MKKVSYVKLMVVFLAIFAVIAMFSPGGIFENALDGLTTETLYELFSAATTRV